jgi:type I restriction enzyme M protein
LNQPPPSSLEAQLNALNRTFDYLQDLSHRYGQKDLSIEILIVFALKYICDIKTPGEQASAQQIGGNLKGWSAVVHEAADNVIVDRLLKLANAIESREESLQNVFTQILFLDLRRFDAHFLHHLIFQLSTFSLTCEGEQEIPVFAQWFDKRLSTIMESHRSTSEGVTPISVARLMVRLADLRPGTTILDPCCGIGTVLSQTAQESGMSPKQCLLYGQEINVRSWALCKVRLFLLGYDVKNIILGDTLRRPAFSVGDGVKQFDRVTCDMPMGQNIRGEELEHRYLYRYSGVWKASKVSLESAFIQFVIASMKDSGIAIALVSHSFLFRSGIDSRIREGIVESGYVKAVVGLLPKLRAQTAVETALIVLERHALPAVLFIDASGLQERVRGKMELSDETIQQICGLFLTQEERAGLSRMATLKQIRETEYSLVPKHYISAPAQTDRDVGLLRGQLQSLELEYRQTIEEMDRLLKRLI